MIWKTVPARVWPRLWPPSTKPGLSETVHPTTFENISTADETGDYTPYATDTAGYYMDRTPQIVGPHAGARLSQVRGLGDFNDDGIADFAVGSELIEDPDPANPDVVGAVYIIPGQNVGEEGDYLWKTLLWPGPIRNASVA